VTLIYLCFYRPETQERELAQEISELLQEAILADQRLSNFARRRPDLVEAIQDARRPLAQDIVELFGERVKYELEDFLNRRKPLPQRSPELDRILERVLRNLPRKLKFGRRVIPIVGHAIEVSSLIFRNPGPPPEAVALIESYRRAAAKFIGAVSSYQASRGGVRLPSIIEQLDPNARPGPVISNPRPQQPGPRGRCPEGTIFVERFAEGFLQGMCLPVGGSPP
jgi:hypothetical protein